MRRSQNNCIVDFSIELKSSLRHVTFGNGMCYDVMRILTTALQFLLLPGTYILAQSTTPMWSEIGCALNKEDSAIIVQAELSAWTVVRTSNAFPVYEYSPSGFGFGYRMSLDQCNWRFADTVVSKLNFTANAELVTIWNTSADTFWIAGFTPMIRSDHYYRPCWLHIPFCYYHSMLDLAQYNREENIMMDALATSFRAERHFDTLNRVVRFVQDSNGYLPQASYHHLVKKLHEGTLSGILPIFRDSTCKVPMTKGMLEEITISQDAISIPDPMRPGETFVAWIRTAYYPVGVAIYEQWVPDSVHADLSGFPSVFRQYHREVRAYGEMWSSGEIYWHSANRVTDMLKFPAFNWEPYEQSFRAERYEIMHITPES